MKFDFSKSRTQDLSNKISVSKLDIINSNLLYLTHEIDQVKSIVKNILDNHRLQKQVDDYFDDDSKITPEETKDLD